MHIYDIHKWYGICFELALPSGNESRVTKTFELQVCVRKRLLENAAKSFSGGWRTSREVHLFYKAKSRKATVSRRRKHL